MLCDTVVVRGEMLDESRINIPTTKMQILNLYKNILGYGAPASGFTVGKTQIIYTDATNTQLQQKEDGTWAFIDAKF